MITVKQNLSEKEKQEVSGMIDEFSDPYGEFFITKSNLRLFIKENKALFFESLSRGDKIAWNEKKGIIFVTGWSDNHSSRKYIKILTESEKSAEQLLKVLLWDIKCDLFAKVKRENPIRRILQRNQFTFAGSRGKEVLLKRNYFTGEEYDANQNKD